MKFEKFKSWPKLLWYTSCATNKRKAAYWNETLIARKFDNELWDLSEMLGVLKHEIEAKEHSVSVGVSSFESHGRKVNKESYSTCALNSYLQRGNKNKKVCVFCNSKQYPPWRCSKYTNLSYKREFLKRMLYLFWKRVHF